MRKTAAIARLSPSWLLTITLVGDGGAAEGDEEVEGGACAITHACMLAP